MEDPMAEPEIDVAILPQIAALMTLAVAANAQETPLEGGEDPAFGTVRWRTLFSGDRTPTRGMVLGIAEFGPFGTLLPHRHGPAEIYFGLSGAGVVTIDGVPHPLGPEVALFVPEDAEHGTVAGPEGLRFLYVFPRDSFADVEYRFSSAPNA
ncbi:cupin domain-containing protein [Salipiger thiooxidans]|uniref:cupin domain-containing protein n=1 Tax=Salipiger thiooxidans TaxID=282683 RepID=UPI001CD4C4A0|nr:cupin domain-containing protein [Salipiger thiooxidans]MCA0850885.1 cupin domain-containing protein [Salipiger thiooxidans]